LWANFFSVSYLFLLKSIFGRWSFIVNQKTISYHGQIFFCLLPFLT